MKSSAAAHAQTLSSPERAISFLLRMLPVRNGRHRLLDRIAPQPIGNSSRVVRTTFNGVELLVEIDDLVGWHFAMLRSFDPEVTDVLVAASARNQEVVWDIGANKGACSFALAAALPSAKIVVIEPQSRLAPTLVRNLEQICPGRYEFYRVGISVEEGAARLTVPEDNTGSATLHAGRLGVLGKTEDIDLRSASSVSATSSFGWPTLAKIDVEGHEAIVIESLLPALEMQICKAIVFENRANESVAFASIAEKVLALDYQVFGILKSPFSTRLSRAKSQLPGVTDYVIAHQTVVDGNPRFASLIK